ncbi:DUF6597 domain-containing transcriptional factor [Streptomyces sp. NPDC001568]|uniref:DUF6597 domain-containing transcriptional factor n=1 Tax=Streptomyces sp. NPDC001568 TaxID=3364588 RepID=UPI0036A80F28
MAPPRTDSRGIIAAPDLFARVRFRRREPAEPLRPYVEHYWLIDWDLTEPYAAHVVPHPCVNVVFLRDEESRDGGEVAGVGLGLFTRKLRGRGRVCGAQFRPGGFRPFLPGRSVSELTGRRLPLPTVYPGSTTASGAVLGPASEDARVAAFDTFLLSLSPAPDPQAERAMAVADLVRRDRSVRRVDELAEAVGLSVRSLQRLFSGYLGVSPKWAILRYRIHEALERAGAGGAIDWAALAVELGYSDQAHLVRDFTTRIGVPPTAYAQALTVVRPPGPTLSGG